MPKPKGWRNACLGDVCEVVGGTAFPREYQGQSTLRYPFFKVGDMNTPGNERWLRYANNYVDESTVCTLKAKLHPRGTVVFPKVGAALLTNKRRLLERESLFDNNVMGLIPRGVDEQFIYQWMQTVDFSEMVQPGAVPSVNGRMVRTLAIDLPALPEQRKIAAILSSVDATIEKTEAVVEQLQVVKKAMMQELLTRGLPGRHTRFKKTEVGEVPDKWEVLTVDALLEDGTLAGIQDGNHGELHPKVADFTDTGIPFVMARDLSHGTVNLKSCAFITKALADGLRVGFAEPGDVLLSHKGTVGRIALVPEVPHYVMLTPQVTYYRIADKERLLPSYLLSFFESAMFQRQLEIVSRQSTRAYIGITGQRRLIVILPSHQEQLAIGQAIEGVSQTIHSTQHETRALVDLKSALMSVLLTGEVRVTPYETIP